MPKGSNWTAPYPPEFRREALRLLVRRVGREREGVARELGVSRPNRCASGSARTAVDDALGSTG